MDNIIENNKLIAEFLNWEFDDLSETFETPFLKLVEPHAFGDEQFSCKLQDFELEFHSDWNWLTVVVRKCREFSNEEDSHWENIYYALTDLDIYKVYMTCVQFIKWYNEQNKNNESL